MSVARRDIVTAGAWAVPAIAVGSPAPKTAASCDVEVRLVRIEKCGKDYTLVLRIYTPKARSITFIPGSQWKVKPETINVPAKYSDHELLITPGKGKIFAMSWVATDGCRTTGCFTVDVRNAR